MTDENQEPEVPEFDDPSYAELQALLADAAAPAAMPADVAARLDATLADLVADRAASAGDPVVPLRRRRPIGQRLLVAAAVVVLGAGGVGVVRIVDSTQHNDSLTAATADRDSSAEAPVVPPASAPEAAVGGTGSSGGLGAVDQRNLMQRLSTTEFTTAEFPRQVTDFVEVAASRSTTSDNGGRSDPGTVPSPNQPYSSGDAPSEEAPTSDRVQSELNNLDTAAKAAPPCAGPALPEGAVALRITFDSRPAALVLHPVTDGSRYVAAWSCDGRELLAFTTLPS